MIPTEIFQRVATSSYHLNNLMNTPNTSSFFFTFELWKNVPVVVDVLGFVTQLSNHFIQQDKVDGYAINITPKSTLVSPNDYTFNGLNGVEKMNEVKSTIGADFLYNSLYDSENKKYLNNWTSQRDVYNQLYDVGNAYIYRNYDPLPLATNQASGEVKTRTIIYDDTGSIVSDTTVITITPTDPISIPLLYAYHSKEYQNTTVRYLYREVITTVEIFETFGGDTAGFFDTVSAVYELKANTPTGLFFTYDHTVKEFSIGDGFTLIAPEPITDEDKHDVYNQLTYQRGLAKKVVFSSILDVFTLLQVPS
ncbi:MAG: hypothetical protein GY750_20965 [Lentisphaerae bacterium]|nr:hypothetical protein [Lentisphaerota bacterium]